MYDCVTNSRIINASLDMSPKEDYDACIKTEFKNMCSRFDLSESEMISLVTTFDIALLDNHYDTIWDSLNYYSMICMDEFTNRYLQNIYDTNTKDDRIYNLCDDLREYISNKSLVCMGTNICKTYGDACKNKHYLCVKYLLDNPEEHDIATDKLSSHWTGDKFIIDYLCKIGCTFDVIKYAFEVKNNKNIYKAIDYLSERGQLDIIKYFFEEQNITTCTTEAIDLACMNGHMDVIKYLFEVQHQKCSMNALSAACENGHHEVVKYLFEIKPVNYDKCAMELACIHGHLKIVKYLFEVQNKNCPDLIIDRICCNGSHIDVIKYLFEKQHKNCTTNAIDFACYHGHIDVVKYLFEVQNKDCSKRALDYACESGHIDIIKYLLEKQHKKYFPSTINIAILHKHDDITKYLLEKTEKQ